MTDRPSPIRMPLSRAAALVAVWTLAFAALAHAYTLDVLHLSLDSRVHWALPICAGAFVLGHAIGWSLGRRRGDPPLGALRHGALLVLLAGTIQGFAYVAPETTADVLIRELPPSLAFVHPLIALLAPLVLRFGARSIGPTDHVLLLALFATVQSGALLFLDGSAALGLAIVATLARMGEGARWPRPTFASAAVAVTLLALVAGAVFGPDEAFSRPALRHLLAASLLMITIALVPRDAEAWRRILAAPVLAAVVMAVAEVAVTIDLGLRFSFEAAFDTRLVLFRQHPNFLAPLFCTSALLAAGHAFSRRRGALAAFAAALLLGYATWRTDSNTGRAALLVGAATWALLPLARRLVRRFGGRRVAWAAFGLVVGVGAAAGAVVTAGEGAGRFVALLERGEKSLDYRVDAWRNAVAVVRENPLLGLGPRTFLLRTELPPGSRFANENEIPHPHNAFLYVAQSGGVLAFLGVLCWLVALAARLFRRALGDDELPPVLVISVAAALSAQLFANLLDLGQALDTVVPWPVFLVTGLVLARDARGRRSLLPGVAGLAVAALAVLFVLETWRPLRALTLVRRANVHGTYLDRTSQVEELRRRMCEELRDALRLDPIVRGGAELLSKTLVDLGGPAQLDEARDVLVDAANRAPDDGEAWSRLGRFMLDRERLEQAWFALSYGDRGVRGAKDPIGDRALVVVALARAGQLADAKDALVKALRHDHEALDRLEFEPDAAGHQKLLVDGRRREVRLLDALDELADDYRQRELDGESVGRKRWMDLFHAYFRAGYSNRAAGVLDFVSEHVPEIEAHSVAWERGRLARAEGEVEAALKWFREAISTSRLEIPVYQDALRALEAEAAGEEVGDGDEAPPASAPSTLARRSLGDLIDIRTAYPPHLEELSRALAERGEPLRAAEVLAAMLLFVDDPIARARVRLRAAELELEGGDDAAALASLDDALVNLWARRHQRRDQMLLADGRPIPVAIAQAECSIRRRGGMDDDAIVRSALSRPEGRAFRRASILYRLGLLEALERWERLLEEAELALLQDDENVTAREAKRTSLARLGRTHELQRFERSIELAPSSLEGRAGGGP